MKKKVIAVLLSVAAGACIFAGCGGQKTETEEKSAPDTVIKREIPDIGRNFDGILPVPPKHKIPKPTPLPAPNRRSGINIK